MIHIYKAGGDWTDKNGRAYTVRSVNAKDVSALVAGGWFKSLDECFTGATVEPKEPENKLVPAETADYERHLRDEIKARGGKAGPRAKIETLEKVLESLKNGD